MLFSCCVLVVCHLAPQAGYSISASGDIMASHRQPSLAGSQSGLGPRSTAGSMMGALKALGQRQSSHIGSGLSTPTGSLPYGLGSERVSLPLSTADGASSPLPHGESSAVPPVDLVTNPVVANLEAAFNQDPRRHRRNDSRLSTMSIGSLSRYVGAAVGVQLLLPGSSCQAATYHMVCECCLSLHL